MTMLSRLKRDLTMADTARVPGGARVDLVLVSEMVALGAKVLDIGAATGSCCAFSARTAASTGAASRCRARA